MTSDFSSGLSSEVPLMLALALVLPRPRHAVGSVEHEVAARRLLGPSRYKLLAVAASEGAQ